MVNAYAPWEYAYMYPFSALEVETAWLLYCLLMFAACGVLVWFGWRVGVSRSDDPAVRRLVMAVPLLSVAYVLWSNWSVGNFISVVLCATVLMVICLESGRDWWAGVFWAVAMVKPQIGLVFAVPMLWFGKWRTCLVAAGICLTMTGIMSWVLRTSAIDLLMQGPAANTSFFYGCGTWPECFCGKLGPVQADIIFAALLGTLICCAMTWAVRGEKSWITRMFPAALCSCCWTYTQAYSHAMGYFLILVLAIELTMRPRSRVLWILLALSLLSVPRFYLAWHGAFSYFDLPFPLSDHAHRCVDSLNSSLTLVLGIALCLDLRMKAKRGECTS